MRPHRYSGLRDVAHRAVGEVPYTVICPLNEVAARARQPYGPESVEYGPVREETGRRPFDVEESRNFIHVMAIREREHREQQAARRPESGGRSGPRVT